MSNIERLKNILKEYDVQAVRYETSYDVNYFDIAGEITQIRWKKVIHINRLIRSVLADLENTKR